MRILSSIILGLVISLISISYAAADTVNWLYDTDGNWSTPSNWSSSPALPGANDDVVIDRPGFVAVTLSNTATIHSLDCRNTLTLSSPLSVVADSEISGTLNLVSSTSSLGGTGKITVSGQLNWTLGSIGGAGGLLLTQDSVTSMFGQGTANGVVENGGQFSMIQVTQGPSAPTLTISGSSFTNLSTGTFTVFDNAQGTSTLFGGSPTNAFNNAGTFNLESASTATRSVAVTFNNTGTINVDSGRLSLARGSNAGIINVSPAGGLTANFFTNAGTINIQGATSGLLASPLITGTSFINSASGHINLISGPISLTGGTNLNNGEINIANAASLLIDAMGQTSGSKITGAGNLTLSNIADFSGTIETTGSVTITRNTNFNSNQTFSGPLTIQRAQTENSTLGGTGNLTVANALNWRAGNLTAGGKITLASASISSISLNAASSLGRVLENAGTINFDGGSISSSTGGRINNLSGATFNVYAPASNWGSLPFDNAGTLNFEGGTAQLPLGGTAITNSGTINVTTGVATIGGSNSGVINVLRGASISSGSVLQNTGTVNFDSRQAASLLAFTNAAGGKLNVLSGALSISSSSPHDGQIKIAQGASLGLFVSNSVSSTLSGAGSLSIGVSDFSGALQVTGPITLGTTNFNTPQNILGPAALTNIGEKVGGSADVTLSGGFNWLQGTMTGTGKTIIPLSTNATLTAGTLRRTLENSGTIALNGSTNFVLNDGQLKNLAGGVININTSTGGGISSTGTSSFNNAGVVNVALAFNTTTPTFNEAAPLTNSGTINVDYGTLNLPGGVTNTGTINVRTAGVLSFPTTAGQFVNEGILNFSGSSNSPRILNSFTNGATGELNVTSGTLTTSDPNLFPQVFSLLQNAGKVHIAENASFSAAINSSVGSSIDGAGKLSLQSADFSGALNVTGPVFLTSVNFNTDQEVKASSVTALSFGGPGNVVVLNDFLWTVGSSSTAFSGTGKLTLQGSSLFSPTAPAGKISKLIENTGRITWNFKNSNPYLFNDGTLNNLAGGTIDAVAGSAVSGSAVGTANAINNFGLFNKLGTGFLTLSGFNNSSVVNVREGFLHLGGGTHSGLFNISSGAFLQFKSTSPVFNPGTAIAGTGGLSFLVDATLPGPNTFSGTTTVTAALQLANPLALEHSAMQLTGGTLGTQGLMTAKLASLQMDSASILDIELGGSTAGLFDRLDLAGAANLNGTLRVSLANSFMPAQGSVFDLLDATSIAGTFLTLQLPALTGPLVWNTNQLYTLGSLSVVEGFMPGDLDRDGKVTGADIPALLTALVDLDSYESAHGLTVDTLCDLADFDHSGAVTNADMQGLLDLIAVQPQGSGSLAAVPEPAALTTACLAAFGLVIVRRVRRSKTC